MLDLALALAQAAGAHLMQAFGRTNAVQNKGDISNVVTDADLESERIIVTGIRSWFPTHAIIAEESGHTPGTAGYTWVVDPLDGTSNFAAGIPWFGVLIAVLDGASPVTAVLHLPVFGQTYTARAGHGAECNGKPIRVTGATALRDVLWAYGMDAQPTQAARERDARLLARLLGAVRNVRATNSLVDAAYTADGRLGGMLNRSTRLWDIAAPMLIVSEAGGMYTAADGSPLLLDVTPAGFERVYQVLAGAPALHREVAQIVRDQQKD
jgi:myo-inositol-1(or 4)-monophosphatase